MNTLLELAEQCEKATGPDRELDFWIYVRLNPGKDSDEAIQQDIDLVGIDGMHIPHAYTASIDAARTLMPSDRAIRREWLPAGSFPARCYVHKNDTMPLYDSQFSFKALGRTEALADCAAALRARAALSSTERE